MVYTWLKPVFTIVMLVLALYMLIRSLLVSAEIIVTSPATETYIALYVLGFMVAIALAFLPWLMRDSSH